MKNKIEEKNKKKISYLNNHYKYIKNIIYD